MAIRYDKKINNEIRRIVNNYNAKIKRLEGRTDVSVPSKIYTKEIKEGIKNRADLRRKLKNLQEFTKKGGEKNITVKGRTLPQYQYKQAQRYRNLISKRLKAREQFNISTYPTYEGRKEKFTIAEQFNEEQRNIEAQRRMLLDVDYLDYSPSEMSSYIENLEALDSEFRALDLSGEKFIVADRFPFLYLAREYNLDYLAAFPGCSDQTHSSFEVMTYLIGEVKEHNVRVIFKTEDENAHIATQLSDSTGAEIYTLYSCQSITKAELDSGETYLSLMRKNLETMKEAYNAVH